MGPDRLVHESTGPAPAQSALERFELSPFCFLHRACAMPDDLVEDGPQTDDAYAADVFWGSKDDRANALTDQGWQPISVRRVVDQR